MDVIIIGAGIGGLTLALTLHRAGIASQVYESASVISAIGAGINILPHASRHLAELGLLDGLLSKGVATAEAVFFNRFGQLIYDEPLGCAAGYDHPQVSIHRGDLQHLLLEACTARLGADRIHTGWKCTGYTQDTGSATAHFVDSVTGDARPDQRGEAVIACDGLHSVIRKQLHPDEGEPVYSGVNMWRGVAPWAPYLSGASMVRAGWLAGGKMVIYPIRNNIDAQGRQLVNWVAEIETTKFRPRREWNRPGNVEDFIAAFDAWHFDWLDVPALIRASPTILEFPMIDQDPLPWWTQGRVTLLGDAAHPMVPRGSNGAGQAILDARALLECWQAQPSVEAALQAYESARLKATTNVVLANRQFPPDAILREIHVRTGDRPFERIEDVISRDELRAITDRYKQVAQYDLRSLR